MIEEVKETQSILSSAIKGAIYHDGEWLIGENCHLETPEIRRLAKKICQLFEPKGDEEGLLTQKAIDDEDAKGIIEGDIVPYLKAQRDLTRRKCQERIDKLIANYTGYIEARKSDLSGMPPLSIPHSMSLRVRRDTLDFALKTFLHLANK